MCVGYSLYIYIFLDLSDNDLHGNIPCDFELFPNILFLYMSGNQFSGTLPTSLASAINLIDVDFSHNKLHGAFPYNHALSLGRLQAVDFSFNQLSGSLAPFATSVNTFHVIQLNNNRFSGPIDDTVFNSQWLKDLTFIDICNNLFTGTVSPSIFELPSLQVFSASTNCFSSSSGSSGSKIESLLPVWDM